MEGFVVAYSQVKKESGLLTIRQRFERCKSEAYRVVHIHLTLEATF
jgi:hypothetical protein